VKDEKGEDLKKEKLKKKPQGRPKLEKKMLNIRDAYTLDPPRYKDWRGYFQELYNDNTYPALKFKQFSISRSHKDVLRGLHCSFFGKFVSCFEGAIWDCFVDLRPDSPTFKQWCARLLSEENGCQMYVPPRCAHGFLALRDNSKILYMQEDSFTPERDVCIHPLDEEIGIEWPKPEKEYIMSNKDKNAPTLKEILPRLLSEVEPEKAGSTVDYVVMGSQGFLGESILRILKDQKKSYAIMPDSVQMSDRKTITEFVKRWNPKYLICDAGDPSFKAASSSSSSSSSQRAGAAEDQEDNKRYKAKAIDINVTGQLNVAEICRELGIHCTLFEHTTAGCSYSTPAIKRTTTSSSKSSSSSSLPSSLIAPCLRKEDEEGEEEGYTKNDLLDLNGAHHLNKRMSIALELLMSQFSNVLLLRIALPIDSFGHSSSFQSYLLSQNSNAGSEEGEKSEEPESTSTGISCIPTSYTIVNSLFPLIPQMAAEGVTGIYNFANPGVTTDKYILKMYQKHVDSTCKWKETKKKDHRKQISFQLDVTKLLKIFPDIPHVEKAAELSMQKQGTRKRATNETAQKKLKEKLVADS